MQKAVYRVWRCTQSHSKLKMASDNDVMQCGPTVLGHRIHARSIFHEFLDGVGVAV